MAESRRQPKEAPEGEYPSALSARIGFLLARAHVMAREEADRALAEVGLSMKGYAALATLVSDGPTSQHRLSQRIRMDPATMVDVIDSLERSGHIVRHRNQMSATRQQFFPQTHRIKAIFEFTPNAFGLSFTFL